MDLGSWQMGNIEDKASVLEQQDRFDRWVERACFQYHPINPVTPAPQTTNNGCPARMRRRSPASKASIGQTQLQPSKTATSVSGFKRKHLTDEAQPGKIATRISGFTSNGSEKNTHIDPSNPHPPLTMSTAGLYLRETPGEHPITVHAAPPCTARVINTLLRIVHGGSVGWGGLPHGCPDNPLSC